MAVTSDSLPSRNNEILRQFRMVLDRHLDEFMAGRVERMYGLKEIADLIHLHPVHLSRIIKKETGHHACYFYEQRILTEAKQLLADLALSIREIAHRLDYDVSNFTKFFKRFTGVTPSVYRKSIQTPAA